MKLHYRKLLSLGSVYTLGSILENGLSFLLLPLLTVYLSVEDFGVVGMMTAILALVSAFLYAPFGGGFQRFYHMEGYREQREALLFSGLSFIGIQALGIALVFLFFSESLARTFLGSEDLAWVFSYYGITAFCFPLQQTLLVVLRIQQKARLFTLLNVSRLILYVGLVLYLLVALKMGLKALVIGYLFKSAFDLLVLGPYVAGQIKLRFLWQPMKALLSYGYPLVMAMVALTVLNASDRFVLEFFDPTLTHTGLYSFAYRFATIVGILLTVPMQHTVNPILMEIEAQPEELKQFLRRTTNYFYLLGLFLCLGLGIYAKEIVEIVARNPAYWPSWAVIPVLAFTMVVSGMNDLFAKGLALAKKTRLVGRNYLLAAGLNIGLNFLLIPFMGIHGAAWATLLSFLFMAGLSLLYAQKLYPIPFALDQMGKMTLIAALLLVLGLLLNQADLGLFLTLLAKVPLWLLFPWLVMRFHLLNPDERAYLSKLFSQLKQKIPLL